MVISNTHLSSANRYYVYYLFCWFSDFIKLPFIPLFPCHLLVTHCSVLSNSFATPWTQAIRLLCPWNFSSKNTTVGCHFLLQGIFPAQGSKLCLLQWQADSLPLSHLGSPGCLLSSTIFFHFIMISFLFPLLINAHRSFYHHLKNTSTICPIEMLPSLLLLSLSLKR